KSRSYRYRRNSDAEVWAHTDLARLLEHQPLNDEAQLVAAARPTKGTNATQVRAGGQPAVRARWYRRSRRDHRDGHRPVGGDARAAAHPAVRDRRPRRDSSRRREPNGYREPPSHPP